MVSGSSRRVAGFTRQPGTRGTKTKSEKDVAKDRDKTRKEKRRRGERGRVRADEEGDDIPVTGQNLT